MARSRSQSAVRYPLTHIFGVDSNVGVLRELVRHGGALSSSQIQERSGLSKTVVRLALISLQEAGMVSVQGPVSTRLYRFNDAHFLGPSVAALYQAEKDRFAAIIASVRNSAGQHRSSLRSLWIYGSVARKQDTPESDLDIGVIARACDLPHLVETIRENLRGPANMLGFLPNVVGLDIEDAARLADEADPWWLTMSRDAIVLAGDPPDSVSIAHRNPVHG